MEKFKILLLSLLISVQLSAQKHIISGYITDKKSGERLIGANIYDKNTFLGAISNNYGFYSLSHQDGPVEIIASYVGYEPVAVTFILAGDTVINFGLDISTSEIEAVTVVSTQKSKVESTQMSMVDIPIMKIKSLPVIFGEADVLKVIQLLPGVQSGTEGSTGIYVRGGGPDQNLFLLDGVPVYNVNHLFGFLSVFNPDAIQTVQLYKGGFPARFGERLSSVVDIRMKEGNQKEYHGNFSIGLIASKFSIEGPVIKDKTSFVISARRTYIDILAQPVIRLANAQEDGSKLTAGYYFYDLNGKINHKFSDRSRLYLSAYLGSDETYMRDKDTYDDSYNYGDKMEYKDKFGMGWGNAIAALRWNYLLTNRLFSNTTLTYSKYIFDITSESKVVNLTRNLTSTDFFRYFSGIEDISARVDFDFYPGSHHSVKFGASYTHHIFKPGVTRFKFDYEEEAFRIDTTFGDENIFADELVGYAEDNFDVTSWLKVNAGLHYALYHVQNTSYSSLQPRFSMRILAGDNLSFKASYSRMAQFVHLLTTSAISLPTDLWLPVTKKFEPPVSHQVAAGTSIRLPASLDFTFEAFYKTMDNLIEYKEGASFGSTGSGWETKVEKGKGWSYGAEFMIEKTTGNTTGWIGYTLAKTERQFEKLNFGKVFPAKYDRRHDVSIVLTHKFNERMDMGVTWVYGTGTAATLGIMKYPAMNIPGYQGYNYFEEITEYESRNNYRTPAYHRLDIGFSFHKEKKRGMRTWNISVYNAYNRKNPFFIAWDSEYYYTETGGYFGKPVLKQYSLFPIIPSVSWSFNF
jgi:outer membrane cobalamin receptor